MISFRTTTTWMAAAMPTTDAGTFHAVTPEHGGRPVGDGYSDSMDEAMRQAIAHANEHYGKNQN